MKASKLFLLPLSVLALIAASSASHASPTHSGTWRAIVFGGVDKASDPANIFQASITGVTAGLVQNGWQVVPLFGNEAACTHCSSTWSVDPIAQAAGISSSEVKHASKLNLMAALDQAIQDLGTGDQLLVSIDTHGMVTSYQGATTTMLSVFEESDPFSQRQNFMDSHGHQIGSMYVNDADLTSRYQKLKAKGVKLAFNNDSCFSGPTAKVLQTYGCVVTQTTSGKYGLGSPVSDTLSTLMTTDSKTILSIASGQNGQISMEDIFLGTATYATNGLNSPYYLTPFAGVLEPQFSAYLDQFDSVENLSKTWLLNLPKTELSLSQGQLLYTGKTQDFAALKTFIETYLSAPISAEDDALFKRIAAYHLKDKIHLLNTNEIDSPTQLVGQIESIESDLQNAPAAYQALNEKQADIESKIQSSNLLVSYVLDEQYAEGQSAFQNALRSLDGKGIHLLQTSSSSMANPWITVIMSTSGPIPQSFYAPTDIWFKAQIAMAANAIATEMGKTYPAATNPAFKASLAGTILNGQLQAWNSADDETKAALASSNQIMAITPEKQKLIASGDTLRLIKMSIEARIYTYLAYRNAAGLSNPNVQSCKNFILRDAN